MENQDRAPFDLRGLSDDLEVQSAFYGEKLLGKVESNWEFLRFACASSAWNAGQALDRLHTGWAKQVESPQHRPGEVEFMLELNYRILAAGPLLSSVLLPGFAIEAFIRLIAEICLYRQVESAPALRLAVNGVDSLPFEQRLKRILELCESKPISKNLLQEIQQLVEFRNSTVHSAPVLYGPDGFLLQYKRGETKILNHPKRPKSPYPDLTDGLPLTLEHTMMAVSTHDQVVSHLLNESTSTVVTDVRDRVQGTVMTIRQFGADTWLALDPVRKAWTDVIRWKEGIQNKDREDFFASMGRRLNLKITP